MLISPKLRTYCFYRAGNFAETYKLALLDGPVPDEDYFKSFSEYVGYTLTSTGLGAQFISRWGQSNKLCEFDLSNVGTDQTFPEKILSTATVDDYSFLSEGYATWFCMYTTSSYAMPIVGNISPVGGDCTLINPDINSLSLLSLTDVVLFHGANQ